MPFVLILLGITLIATALRGTTGALFTAIKADFTGSDNFIYWLLSLIVIGSVGYIKRLQPVANMFLLLVILVMFIANKGGFFAQFMAAIKTPATNCGQAGSDISSAASAPGTTSNPDGSNILGNSSSSNMNASLPAATNSTSMFGAGENLFSDQSALGNALINGISGLPSTATGLMGNLGTSQESSDNFGLQ